MQLTFASAWARQRLQFIIGSKLRQLLFSRAVQRPRRELDAIGARLGDSADGKAEKSTSGFPLHKKRSAAVSAITEKRTHALSVRHVKIGWYRREARAPPPPPPADGIWMASGPPVAAPRATLGAPATPPQHPSLETPPSSACEKKTNSEKYEGIKFQPNTCY